MFSLKDNKLAHLKSLEAFAVVMETGSITKAAEKMNVTQPSVSQHIQRLETNFETQLFIRQNGRIFPTERAKILLEDVTDLLSGMDKTFAKWQRGQTRHVNRLRICASFSNCSLVLPQLLTKLPRQQSMHFQVTSATLAEATTALNENHADIAFHTKPLTDNTLESIRFLTARQVCVLPKSHPLTQKSRIAVKDLNDQRLISVPKSDLNYRDHHDVINRHQIKFQNVLETPYATLAMQMAEEFSAIYIGNILIAELFCQKNPGVVWREIEEFDLPTHFYYALSPWLQNSEIEEELKQAISDAFTELSTKLEL